jgi:hypothetical protein
MPLHITHSKQAVTLPADFEEPVSPGRRRNDGTNPCAGGDRMNFDNVDCYIEYDEIYDGWTVAVMKDGNRVNHWQDPENPGRAIEVFGSSV